MEMDWTHFKETRWRHRRGCIRLKPPRCQKERMTKKNLEKENRRGNNKDGKHVERG
jgi:hypothetical protein